MHADRKNIVLVSIDSLRADHCGHLGDDRGLTPAIDALARDGVAFENAVSPGPRTFSTMPAVFTGRHRPRNTLDSYPDDNEWRWRLEDIDAHLDRHAPFPERLKELGYTTAGISPNPWTSSASGFNRGFDHYVDLSGREQDSVIKRVAARLPGVDAESRPVELLAEIVSQQSFFVQWESFYDDVQAVRERLEEPYLLWVFLLDTHYPFITSRRHRTEQSAFGMYSSMYRAGNAMRGNTDELAPAIRASLQRSYRDTVRAADAFVDRLRTDLEADDPVTMIHSDHGEAFGEHGGYGHHRGTVYEENVHVPYVVHNAGVTADVPEPVSLATIHDTILTLARGEAFDPDAVTAPYVFASDERGNHRAVRGRRFKHVVDDGDGRLFDLQIDPAERRDYAADLPAIVRELRRHHELYESHHAEIDALARHATTVATRSEL